VRRVRNRNVETWVDGERRRASPTRELVFSAATLVSFVSDVMTPLECGVVGR
jgi:2-keto-4-pentenoate hydratase/2-oxohepta-3-ene-1,7-dioic acid hydratase in catechol pathway